MNRHDTRHTMPRNTPRPLLCAVLFSVFAIFLSVASAVPANAQAPAPVNARTPAAKNAAAAPSAEAEANNPLAKFQAFNMHNYYVPALSEAEGQKANTFWFRYAQPVGKWLFRGSLPVQRAPTGVGLTTSGLGDFSAFLAYLFNTGNPKVSFGLGPQFTVPTASDKITGAGKWQGGFATTYFNATSPTLQWGGLVTWQMDFAGDSERPGTNVLAVQPFYFVQLGGGLYVRGAPAMVFNMENDSYNVPVGLGLGKVVRGGSKVFNIWIEPQFTILSRGAAQPELQIFVGFNTQFLKK